MANIVRIKRRIGADGFPPLLRGEPAYNRDTAGHDDLAISDGTATRLLVSRERQVELAGDQLITGTKTIDIDNLKVTGGAEGDVPHTDGDGNLRWQAPFTGVAVDPPLAGAGTANDPLTVTPTTYDMVAEGHDDVFPVTAQRLRSIIGADVAELTTTAKQVVPSINELREMLLALIGILRFVGTYDVANDMVTPSASSPAVAGPLPEPAPATEGWVFMVTAAGTGTGNAPPVSISAGDWLVSTGFEWMLFDLDLHSVAASNVYLSAITGLNATNVQDAIEELTVIVERQETIHVDGTSIVGDGRSPDTPLAVDVIDGGVY